MQRNCTKNAMHNDLQHDVRDGCRETGPRAGTGSQIGTLDERIGHEERPPGTDPRKRRARIPVVPERANTQAVRTHQMPRAIPGYICRTTASSRRTTTTTIAPRPAPTASRPGRLTKPRARSQARRKSQRSVIHHSRMTHRRKDHPAKDQQRRTARRPKKATTTFLRHGRSRPHG